MKTDERYQEMCYLLDGLDVLRRALPEVLEKHPTVNPWHVIGWRGHPNKIHKDHAVVAARMELIRFLDLDSPRRLSTPHLGQLLGLDHSSIISLRRRIRKALATGPQTVV